LPVLSKEIRDGLIACFVAVRAGEVRTKEARGNGQRSSRHAGANPASFIDAVAEEIAELWRGLDSDWDAPSISDLEIFRDRLARQAPLSEPHPLADFRRLLDAAIAFGAAIERIRKAPPVLRRLRLIRGEGRHTGGHAPRLHLVRKP
jgi:hypothetical protein